jgi:hypothetical protein
MDRLTQLAETLNGRGDPPMNAHVHALAWDQFIKFLPSPDVAYDFQIEIRYHGQFIRVKVFQEDCTIEHCDPHLQTLPFPSDKRPMGELMDDADFVMGFYKKIKDLKDTCVIEADGSLYYGGLATSEEGAVRSTRTSPFLGTFVQHAGLTHDQAIDLDSDVLCEVIHTVHTLYLLQSKLSDMKAVVRRWMWSVALPSTAWGPILEVAALVFGEVNYDIRGCWLVYVP